MSAAATQKSHTAAQGNDTFPILPQATLDEVISRTDLRDIVRELGGPEIVNGRCAAWYRDGKSKRSLSIDAQRWYDHGTQRGGGVLDLIQLVLGCTRRNAAEWLAAFYGLSLGARTPKEIRKWRRRKVETDGAVDDLAEWRAGRIQALMVERNRCYANERVAEAEANRLIGEGRSLDEEYLWALVNSQVIDRGRGRDSETQLNELEALPPADLALMRNQEAQR